MPKQDDNQAPAQEDSAPAIDPQKKYLMDQFGGLMEQVGDGFGGPLQEELIRRLEQTIADFHEEVTEMLDHLKETSEKRHEKLKEIWENPDASTEANTEEEEFIPGGGAKGGDGGDVSEWEKRLEGMDPGGKSGDSSDAPAEKETPKKKGLFGRKKK